MYKHHANKHPITTNSLYNTSVDKHTSNLFNSIWVWTQCKQSNGSYKFDFFSEIIRVFGGISSGVWPTSVALVFLWNSYCSVDSYRWAFLMIVPVSLSENAWCRKVSNCYCSHLVQRLCKLPADVVGSRLTKMLLSRLVVINSAACTHLMPHLLTPATGMWWWWWQWCSCWRWWLWSKP